jgi:hypothetical protein
MSIKASSQAVVLLSGLTGAWPKTFATYHHGLSTVLLGLNIKPAV